MMIPFIPSTNSPVVASGPTRPVEPDPEGYPKRSCCEYCEEVIKQVADGAPWTVGNLLGGDNPECPKAPNPDDGPMPHHAPGIILHPPKL
ncbi:hypothetical protein [Streptomyces cucumeris]|uniref:hypothetical protein n=1 Tax=Streptomyces cucumeris TaxID=2962890 RepID=UPI0020C8B9BF|nr:hypothetical protein [Streptomyces sp. NEAU-Y11]MCP9209597.1 hypothetical protein [Streptomyces sp. NEAU-Y11]